MKNNIFKFGSLNFLQLVGTAMGTSSACMWATLYYGWHENQKILPTYEPQLLYFKRYQDDIFAVWLVGSTHASVWASFKRDLDDFGILRWDIEEPSHSVNYLDITITLKNGAIETKTFQKPRNLYLYLPKTSAHPRGCLKGTIFGLIRRYHSQNTHRKDFVRLVALLFRRLLDRGWQEDDIRPLILDACKHADARAQDPKPHVKKPTKREKNLFIHLKYHPDDVPRGRIRQLYDQHLGQVLKSELGIERPVIAYSRPPNLGDRITQAKFHEAPGRPSTFYMGELNQGLDP